MLQWIEIINKFEGGAKWKDFDSFQVRLIPVVALRCADKVNWISVLCRQNFLCRPIVQVSVLLLNGTFEVSMHSCAISNLVEVFDTFCFTFVWPIWNFFICLVNFQRFLDVATSKHVPPIRRCQHFLGLFTRSTSHATEAITDEASKIDEKIHTRWMRRNFSFLSFSADSNFDFQVQRNSFLFYWIKFSFSSFSLLTESLFAVFICCSSTFVCHRLRCRFYSCWGFTCLDVYGFGVVSVLWIQINFAIFLLLSPSLSLTFLKVLETFFDVRLLLYLLWPAIAFLRNFLRKVKLSRLFSPPRKSPLRFSIWKGSKSDVNRERFSCLIRFSVCSKPLKVSSLESSWMDLNVNTAMKTKSELANTFVRCSSCFIDNSSVATFN